jgi:Protein of unknown function (DUF2442)
MLHVSEVRPAGEYRLWLRFSDGFEGEVDLDAELEGPVFGPLRDPAAFAQVSVDTELRTVAWPNGADLAPEYLHDLAHQRAAA